MWENTVQILKFKKSGKLQIRIIIHGSNKISDFYCSIEKGIKKHLGT